jgi:hypothetical protein
MPDDPNSRSDGSMEESETVCVTAFSVPAQPNSARPCLRSPRYRRLPSIFTILSIERQRTR